MLSATRKYLVLFLKVMLHCYIRAILKTIFNSIKPTKIVKNDMSRPMDTILYFPYECHASRMYLFVRAGTVIVYNLLVNVTKRLLRSCQ